MSAVELIIYNELRRAGYSPTLALLMARRLADSGGTP